MRRNGHEVFDVENPNNSAEAKAIKEQYAKLWNHLSELESKTEIGDVKRYCATARTQLELSEAMANKAIVIK